MKETSEYIIYMVLSREYNRLASMKEEGKVLSEYEDSCLSVLGEYIKNYRLRVKREGW
jgi:hypothetical protein